MTRAACLSVSLGHYRSIENKSMADEAMQIESIFMWRTFHSFIHILLYFRSCQFPFQVGSECEERNDKLHRRE